MSKRKILFLGESYRADAITWMNGLKEFGDFEIITWELQSSNAGFNRMKRIFEYLFAIFKIKKLIRLHQPDMVIAERTTSYGFLAALCGVSPVAIAQQGRTDLWPEHSISIPYKRMIQNYAFKKATLIHAWGPVMTISMREANVDMNKVLVLPKGVDLDKFSGNAGTNDKIHAIVTRSLLPEYRHNTILKAFSILNREGIDFVLTVVGDGTELKNLTETAIQLKIEKKVHFTGRIENNEIPAYLGKANIYLSMPTTEGVSASLFEAMASRCYPIVSDLPGNASWITHRKNGQLVTVDDHEMLASEIKWAFEQQDYRDQAMHRNRKFVEEHADYRTNMKIIAAKYHELISTAKNT